MSTFMRIISLERAYNILNENGGIKCINRPLSFTFDVRKSISHSQRELSPWYAFQYCACTDILFIIGVSYAKDQLEAEIEQSKTQTIDFMERYCKKYNPKFNGTICVDLGDWVDSDPFVRRMNEIQWED